MKLLKHEVYKVITHKLFWGFLAAVLIVNVSALLWLNRSEGLPHSETKAMFDAIRTMPRDDKLEYLTEQKEILEYYTLKEMVDAEREFVAKGTGLSTYEDIVSYETQLEELRLRFGERLERDISGAAASTQIALIDRVIGEIKRNDYREFLANIDRKAEINKTLKIYDDENSFEYRNIKKTQANFSDMQDVRVRYDVNLGLHSLFDAPSTDILLVVLILIICIALITDEKDKRLFLLIKSTPGGIGRTIAAKMGAMALCVFCVSLIVFLSNIVFAQLTFGLGDIKRPIQSIPDMMISTMKINLLEFTALFFLVKVCGLIAAGLLVMFLAIHARHGIIVLLGVGIFSVLSVLLSMIPVISSWNWLRFLNFAVLIRPYEVLRRYFNLSLFGYPVGLIPIFLLFVCIVFASLLFAVYFSYVKKRGLEHSNALWGERRFNFSLKKPIHWRWFEFRKIAFTNRALLILAVFAITQIFLYNNAQSPYLGYEHNYIKSFLIANQGAITEPSENFILTEKAKLDEARAEADQLAELYRKGELRLDEMLELRKQYDRTLASEHAINLLYERYEYVRSTPGAEFLYDSGYAELFGLTNADAGLTSGMALIAILAMCLCGVFSIEYKTGMYKILNTAKFGHSPTIKIKLLFSLIFAGIAFICAYLPDLLYIKNHYGFPGLGLPLSSIPPTELGAFPVFMGGLPVWGYLVLLIFVRLIVCLGIAIFILAFSLVIRNNLFTVLCALGVLLAPLLFHVFGITFLDGVSLYRLVSANGLFTIYPLWQTITGGVVFAVSALISVLFLSKRFGRSDTLALR